MDKLIRISTLIFSLPLLAPAADWSRWTKWFGCPRILVETANTLNSGADPLLLSIEKMGSASVTAAGKAKVVLRASKVLNTLGTDPKLVDEIKNLETKLAPLGKQVLRRRPNDAELHFLEGRGAYQKVRINGLEATVYTKGTGNHAALNSGPFPAFPNTSHFAGLFFDIPQMMVRHPRVVGTETVTWAGLELINACVVFDHMVKELGIRTLKDAIRIGITIPVQVQHFPELTRHVQALIAKSKSDTTDSFEIKSMDYEGNQLGLGSVQLVVPTHRRNLQNEVAESIDEKKRAARAFWLDTESPVRVARTLRSLLNSGFAYSDMSSHGANVYRDGYMAQADNSDFVYLGDLRNIVYERQWILTPEEQGSFAIAKQILSSRMLFPPFRPFVDFLDWEEIKKIQKIFWMEFLVQAIPHEPLRKIVAAQIPELMVIHPAATSLALGRFLYASTYEREGANWRRTSPRRQKALRSMDRFGVAKEYAAKFEDNLPDYELDTARSANRRFPVDTMIHFLKTGDRRVLEANSELGRLLQFLKTVDSVPDSNKKTELIGLFAALQFAELRISNPEEIGLLEMFSYQHLELVTKLIAANRLTDAVSVLTVLGTFHSGYSGASYAFGNPTVANRYHYPLELLRGEVPIAEIQERAKYQRVAGMIAGRADNNSLASLVREAGGGEAIEQFSVAISPKDSTYLSFVVYAMLGHRSNTPQRVEIQNWAGEYAHAENESKKIQDPAAKLRVFDRAMSLPIVSGVPELKLVHENYLYGHYFERRDRVQAAHHRHAVEALLAGGSGGLIETVHQLGYSDFTQILQAFPHHNKQSTDVERHRALARECESRGLPTAARYFKLQADGDWFEASRHEK